MILKWIKNLSHVLNKYNIFFTRNTPVCHPQSVQKAWDLKSSKYGQLLKHCHFKYKERRDSEFEENFTNVRRENILLSWTHKMKYLIIGLNFLVENPQALLENTIPSCGSAPLPEKWKSFSPTLFKNGSKILESGRRILC